MNAPESRAQLWNRLKTAGLVRGEPPALSESASPWYVRAMLGVAGWIAALFLFAFVQFGFTAVMNSKTTQFVLGLLLCAGATALFRATPRNDFAAQFAFAVSLAGQALILMGLDYVSHVTTGLVMLAIEATLFLLIANPLHRVWAAAAGTYAACLIPIGSILTVLTPAALLAAFVFVWGRELETPARGALLRAIGYGMALVILLAVLRVDHRFLWFDPMHNVGSPFGFGMVFYLGRALIGAVLIWATVEVLRRWQLSAASGPGRMAIIVAALLSLLSFTAPGIPVTVTMLIVAYGQGSRTLTGLALFGLLAYLGQLYYNLGSTLLEKSIWLAGPGALLLAARYALARGFPRSAAREGGRA